ncbi:MAG: hypothetical protein M1570_12175 [Chloroflexi bacterium]|nr:hypothetical protein [Chloroflexota bacterium]
MSAPAAPLLSGAPERRELFVSTALDTWLTEHSAAFARDVQVDDIAYRRLDPEYYAWLRSRMMLAKAAASNGQLGLDAFDDLRHRYNAIHQWAVERFGEQILVAAVRSLNAREYVPPAVEPDLPRHPIAPAITDRNIVPVSPEAAALVDAVLDRAVALGWTRESLYRTRGSLRFPLGPDYGLVCYLKAGDRIGDVTAHSIEIILPTNIRQRFYNPNVDQPWIKRVGHEKG